MTCLIQNVYVEPLLLFYMTYLQYTAPLTNQLIYHKLCLSHYNVTFCGPIGTPLHGEAQNIVEEGTAQWTMYISMANNIPTIPIVVLLGIWSDRVGRKEILVFSLLGEAMNAVSDLVNTWFITLPVVCLLPGSLVSGLFGNYGGVSLGVFSYIADITTPETRTNRMFMAEAVCMLATIVGNLTGGMVIQYLGLSWLCNLDLFLIFLSLLCVYTLKESYIPPPPQSAISLKDELRAPLRLFSRRSSDNKYRLKLFLLFFFYFITNLQLNGYFSVALLYLFHAPLSFDVAHAGYAIAEGNAAKFFGAQFLSYMLGQRLKWHDSSVMILGSLFSGIFALCLGLLQTHLQVYLSYLLNGLTLQLPASLSALSKLTSPSDQGKLTSITGILQVVSTLLSTVLSLYLYQVTVSLSPAAIIYVLASLSIPTLVCALLLTWYCRQTTLEDVQCEGLLDENISIEDQHQQQVQEPESGQSSSADCIT